MDQRSNAMYCSPRCRKKAWGPGRERYEQIIAAEQIGGAHPAPGEELLGVDASLQTYADDLESNLAPAPAAALIIFPAGLPTDRSGAGAATRPT